MKKYIAEKLTAQIGGALAKALTPKEIKMTVGFDDLTVTQKRDEENVPFSSKSINGECHLTINIKY